jgi:hypothetical protein
MHAPPGPGPPEHVGLSIDVVSGPAGPLARVWTAKCDSPTDFSSIASVNPGIGCVRAGGATTVHLRGPETRAATLSCPRDAEYFGADFRLGAYLPMFPPARLANLQDVSTTSTSSGTNVSSARGRWQEQAVPAPGVAAGGPARTGRSALVLGQPGGCRDERRFGDLVSVEPPDSLARFTLRDKCG